MDVKFESSFVRDLKRIQERPVRRRVARVVEHLERADDLQQISGLKKLQDAPGAYRLRIGQYRMGLIVREGVVILVRFLDRKDVYRHFP